MKRNGFLKCIVALMLCSLLCNVFYVPVFSENNITNQAETVVKASKPKSIKITVSSDVIS